MARFTTRVELHNAGYDDYETLHPSMQAEGFSRTITSDDGKTYHLPDAEYDCSGNVSTADVLAAAKRAASTTGRAYSVFVTEAGRRSWVGLQEVRRHASGNYR